MAEYLITIRELMEECHCNDVKEFRMLLARNSIRVARDIDNLVDPD